MQNIQKELWLMIAQHSLSCTLLRVVAFCYSSEHLYLTIESDMRGHTRAQPLSYTLAQPLLYNRYKRNGAGYSRKYLR